MMKKEFMLAGMITAGVALASTSALANTQGTQTFTANIKDSTCTIAVLDQHIDLGTMLASSIKEAKGALNSSPSAPYSAVVTGCPSSISLMKTSVSAPSMDSTYGTMPNAGTATGVQFFYTIGKGSTVVDAYNNKQILPKSVISTPIKSGGGVLKLDGRIFKSASKVGVGTLQFSSTFTFDFS
ncbi:hypothetical protein CRX10_23570 [Salmonella enterica subsp. enterica serovar Newport]|nr:hypothetical protein [Salmonella enterica subsp. enterica serovar Newport]